MISLAIWALVLWVCFGVGARVLTGLRVRTAGLAEEIPFAVGLGLGLLAYLVLGLGALGRLQVWVVVALLAGLAALGWPAMARLLRRIAAARIRAWRWSAVPLLLFFVMATALSLIGALAPAADNDYDGLVYHLAIPKVYLRDGRIHAVPWLSHSNFPFTVEMLYLLGLLLRDDSLAKLFHFAYGWLGVCAIFAFARHWWGARAGWLGAAIFAAVPLVAWEMMSAYNELAFALYAFLTIYALARAWQEKEEGRGNGWLWTGAILCGLALGVKMLAGAVLVFALGALVWGLLRARGSGRELRLALGFAAIAAAVAAPWYVKSYLWTGNPVYPFMYGLFDGRHWSAERALLYTEAQREFGLGADPLGLLALPWRLTFSPQPFFDQPHALRPFNVLIFTFGPLLLALLPTLPLAGSVRAPGRLALSFALFYVIVWFGLSQNGRYLIPALPGLCACAGLAGSRLLDRRGVAASASALVLLLGLSSGLHASLSLAGPSLRVALGLESRRDYLMRTSAIYPAFEAINRETPPEAKLLLFGAEPRTFYLERDYLLGDHAEIFSGEDLSGPEAFLGAIQKIGVTHLVLHTGVLREVAARRGAVGRALAALVDEGHLLPVGRYRNLSLWRLADKRQSGPEQP